MGIDFISPLWLGSIIRCKVNYNLEVRVDTDIIKGNPEHIVLGKPEERPARVHRRQKPKPPRTTKGILADIKLRKQMLEPVVAEARQLEQAIKVLKNI
jgi:hypothetical protein